MEAIYSFVIDGPKRFEAQTRVFLTTLLATGVEPSSIIAHCTPSASKASREVAARFGVRLQTLEPFLGGLYCNKLAQLPALIGRPADVFVLCDTDLAFVASIDLLFSRTQVRAKPVDLSNPPIATLEQVRVARGIEQLPRLTKTSCDRALTFSVNCNGGLYIIPSELAPKLASSWQNEAMMMRQLEHFLGAYINHSDQIGFAMAMLGCGYDVDEIPIEFNFPMHLRDYFDNISFSVPKVLHYHSMQGDDGRLTATGHPIVDEAVDYVNTLLSGEKRGKPAQWGAFAYWDGSDRSGIHEFIEVWTNYFPAFRVYGDEDIIPLIQKYFPDYTQVFEAVRISAAKADVARLMMLYERGGLYVDCHCGIRDQESLMQMLAYLIDYECVFIDRKLFQAPRPSEEHFLINAIMLSRPQSKLILMIARQALVNLCSHRESERINGHVPYHIGSITGPELVTSLVMEPYTNNREVRSDYRDRVLIAREEVTPVERDRYRTYGGNGQHWSQRQRVELLFK